MNTNASHVTEARDKLLAAIDRAVARAIEQSEAGIRPVLRKSEPSGDGLHTLQRWIVPSRTTDGTLYTVTLIADADGLKTECTCQAGEAGKPCWHRALARRAALHQSPFTDGRRSAPAISLADLHGQPDPWPATDDVADYAAVS